MVKYDDLRKIMVTNVDKHDVVSIGFRSFLLINTHGRSSWTENQTG
jgi:hypothetical protein